jgi:hypothetical protein
MCVALCFQKSNAQNGCTLAGANAQAADQRGRTSLVARKLRVNSQGKRHLNAQLPAQFPDHLHVTFGCGHSHSEFELRVTSCRNNAISSIGLRNIPDLWRCVEMLARGKNNSNDDIAINI